MRYVMRFILKIIWLIILLGLVLVGCDGRDVQSIASGSISTAPRGESLNAFYAQTINEPTSTTPAIIESTQETPVSILETKVTSTSTAAEIPATPTPEPGTATPETDFTTPEPEITTSDVCAVEENRAFESEVIALMNAEREAMGLGVLSEQSQLTAAARQHSTDMACNGFFEHLSPSTGSVIDRVGILGYEYEQIGENIAAGHLSPEEVVDAWMDSPGHRENILNPDYTQVGVGYVASSDSTYGSYWTTVYGTP
jgi:uncharacterized protein YkwD